MDKLIKKLTAEPLSGEDMLRAVDGESIILTYKDLKDVDDIHDLFDPYDNFILLYEMEKNYGHWIAVIYHPESDTIEVFDPYGLFIDDEFKYIRNPKLKKQKYLSKLLLESESNIIYNDQPIQKYSKDVSSCGRHVALRINMRDIPLEEYQDMMMSKGKNERDKIVTMLTAFV